MSKTSTLAEAMAVDGTVFESRPRGSGSIVSELLLEVAIQLEPFSRFVYFVYNLVLTQAIKSLGTM